MPQVTSRQGNSQMRLGSEKPHADNDIISLMPNAVPDSSQREIATPVQPVSILPQHTASLANYHIEIGSGRRHGEVSTVTGGMNCPIGIFNDVSRVKAICTYFVTCQHFLNFSEQIVRQDYLSVCVQGSYGPHKCS